jgi:hypothetical protein
MQPVTSTYILYIFLDFVYEKKNSTEEASLPFSQNWISWIHALVVANRSITSVCSESALTEKQKVDTYVFTRFATDLTNLSRNTALPPTISVPSC